ncbi:hypothetical protein EP7_005027 [Isosphaeraceae bacterium EP7]
MITSPGRADPIRSVVYDAAAGQVTLGLAHPLNAGQFYRVRIDGTPLTGLAGIDGTTFDGDDDQTAAGDFYGLVAAGSRVHFADINGDVAGIRVTGGGRVQVWRDLDGNVHQFGVSGAVPGGTVLRGSVVRGRLGDGVVGLPTNGLDGVDNQLSANSLPISAFSAVPPTPGLGGVNVAPTPVVATSKNLPYSVSLEQVSMPSVPSIQSPVAAQYGGKWLVFGGRTNGLHGFDPTGLTSFPPLYQNNDIFVIDPATGQVWSESWTQTGLPSSMTASLASTNQEFYQKGNRLYAVGGYSSDPSTGTFQTYDTLSSINVSALMDAVIGGTTALGAVRQIQDPRFEVTGGDMAAIGDRTFLVVGHDFQGLYNGSTADLSQVYSSEIRSFRIVEHGSKLRIDNYSATRDPVNYRRRDGNLSPIVASGRPALAYYGGVFTADTGGGFLNPIIIGGGGRSRVDPYQQYFSQYSAPNITLYDARDRSSHTILFGGISLSHYDFSTGQLTQDPGLPFVNDVTALVRSANGSSLEYSLSAQLPGLYGAEARFFAAPGIKAFDNGVIPLKQFRGATTVGYIYGGIISTATNAQGESTASTASNTVFRVVVTPN